MIHFLWTGIHLHFLGKNRKKLKRWGWGNHPPPLKKNSKQKKTERNLQKMSTSLCYNRCLSLFSFFQYSPSWSTGVLLWRQWGEAVGNWTYGFVVCFCYILIIVFFAENKTTIIYGGRLISLFESDFLFLWNTSGINALGFHGSPLPINYLLQCRINYTNPQNGVPSNQ